MSDPKEILEEKCAKTEKCRPLLEAYERCVARVEARGEANRETCEEELFELQPCIDNCVKPQINNKRVITNPISNIVLF